jgi:death-on-curing protein
MAILYLTVDEVAELHDYAIAFGGAAGVRSHHLLASAVFQAQQSVFGEDAYGTLAEKAAAYGFFLVQNHPFVDGNKRTAELALVTFLELNGYALVADEDVIAQMFEDTAAGRVEQAEFFRWVAAHTTPQSRSNVVSFTESEH